MDDVIKGVAVPEIPKKRAIKTGQNAGKRSASAGPRTRSPEEIGLRERLQSQPHPNAGGSRG